MKYLRAPQNLSLRIVAAPGASSRIERVSIALLILACVLEAAGAFAFLGRSSLWIDELYSAYFADGGLRDVIVKTLRFDAHSPQFALLLHGWAALFGRSEAALRAFSATAAVATMPVLYLVSRPQLTRWAALMLTAAVTATYFWFDMAQNVRPYAVALLASSLLLGGLMRAMYASDHVAMRRAAWLIAATALCFGLLHYYVVLLAGLVMLLAIVRMRDRQARCILLASGAALVLLLAGYMALRQASTTMPPAADMWFAKLWRSPSTYLDFVRIALGGPFNKAIFALLLIAGFSGVVGLKWSHLAAWLEQPLPRLAFSSLAVAALFFAVAVLLSAAGIPTVSDRNLALALPFLWMPLCALAEWSMGRRPAVWRHAFMLVTGMLALAAAASAVAFRTLPLRENLRDALHTTAAMPGCAESEIPLSVGSMVPNIYTELMAYYAPSTRFRSLVRDQLTDGATQNFLADRARRIAANPNACRALLLMRETNAWLVGTVARQIAARAGHPVRITGFEHETLGLRHPGHAAAVYLLWVE